VESDKGSASERSGKSRSILARHANGGMADHVILSCLVDQKFCLRYILA